jgi:hypothetical protein
VARNAALQFTALAKSLPRVSRPRVAAYESLFAPAKRPGRVARTLQSTKSIDISPPSPSSYDAKLLHTRSPGFSTSPRFTRLAWMYSNFSRIFFASLLYFRDLIGLRPVLEAAPEGPKTRPALSRKAVSILSFS